MLRPHEKTVSPTRGFTLIELLISLGLVAILSTVGVAIYVGAQRRVALDAVAQEMVVYLRLAQQKAISQEEGVEWGIHFENPSQAQPSFALFFGNPYNVGNVRGKVPLPLQTRYIIPASGLSIDVIFSKLTGTPNGSQTIEITMKGQSDSTTEKRTITINTLGAISI